MNKINSRNPFPFVLLFIQFFLILDNTNRRSVPAQRTFYLSSIDGTKHDNCGIAINNSCSDLAAVINRFTAFDLTNTDVTIQIDGLVREQTYIANYSYSISNIRCLILEPLPKSSKPKHVPKFRNPNNKLIPIFRFQSRPCLKINNIDFEGLLMMEFSETNTPDGNIVISNSKWHVNPEEFQVPFINGRSSGNKPNITVSLTDVILESYNSRPIFLIQQNDLQDMTRWNISLTRTTFSSVGFNLKFNKGKVIATDCYLDSSIHDMYTVTLSNFDELQISGLQLISHFVSPVGDYGVLKVDNIKSVEIYNTNFTNIGEDSPNINQQVLYISNVDDLGIIGCQFHGLFESDVGHLVFIDIKDTLTISECHFKNISRNSKVQGSKNCSLVWLQNITANISITDSKFENVISPTIYCSSCANLDLLRVDFIESFRPIVLLEFKTLNIDTCKFNRNNAEIGAGINIAGPGQVTIINSHFNENFAKQAGAINSQNADVDITDSLFIQNSGNTSGTFRFTGTLEKSKNIVKLTNVFIQSPKKKSREQLPFFSTVMESNGPTLKTKNVTVEILQTVENIDLFVTDVDSSSSLTFRCPVNTRVKSAENLFWSCNSCDKDTYTMQHGETALKGSSNVTNLPFNCKKCPYGGECTGQAQMASRINFWGFADSKGDIKFIQCSPGHCCQDNESNQPCLGISSCANNWEGDVCSKCPENHYASFFESKCIPNDRCDNTSKLTFWVCFVIFTIVLFVIIAYFQEIGQKIGELCTKLCCWCCCKLKFWCCKQDNEGENIDEEKHHRNVQSDEQQQEGRGEEVENENEVVEGEPEDKTDTMTLFFYFIKILLNFYQLENLINIESPKSPNDATYLIRQILSSIFNFQLSLRNFFESYCPTHGMSDPLKLFIKDVLIFILLSVFALVLLAGYIVKKLICKRIRNHTEPGDDGCYQRFPDQDEDAKLTFDTRCKVFLVRVFLLGYTNIATVVMTMCNCVTVGDKMILLVGGEDCHSSVTHLFRVVFLLWVVGFPLNVRYASGLLQRKVITVNWFMFLIYFPPVSFVYFLYRRSCKGDNDREVLEPKAKHMLSMFEASFRHRKTDQQDDRKVVLLWDYCVLARRLVIAFLCVILHSYINRLLCVAFVLFVMMVLHTIKKPYKEQILNWTETCSFLSLSVLALINLVWAFFYVYSLDQQPPIDIMVQILKYFQVIVTVSPVIFFVFVLYFFRK